MKQFIKKIFGIDKIEEAAILKAEHAAKIALETFELLSTHARAN